MTKAKAAALAESDEEAVELRSTNHLRMAAKHSAAIFVGPSSERFRKKPEGLKRAFEIIADQRNTVLHDPHLTENGRKFAGSIFTDLMDRFRGMT